MTYMGKVLIAAFPFLMEIYMNNDVIVLIDTGLDKEIYRNRIVGGIHFYIEDEMICCDKNYNDDNGHGTACADVITRVYKNARFLL